MPRPSNRQQRRRQIAGAMLDVMAERGYDRASIAEVATRAGLNQGLLHYHFKNKQGILVAALRELVDRHAARLDVVLAGSSDEPAGQVKAFIDFHLGLGAAADQKVLSIWLVMSGEALRQSAVQTEYEKALGAITGRLQTIIEQGIKEGLFDCPDAAIAASALMATIQGYFVLAATARRLIPRGSAAGAAVRMAAGLLGWKDFQEGQQDESRSFAVYAGTFDPVTAGHLSVINAAARIFDRVIVLVAVNPDKQPLFTLKERLKMLDKATANHSNVSCESTEGYVVEYARDHGATHMVRGLRDASDAAFETQLAQLNRSLAPEVRTLFVPADPALSEVSSSKLKEMAQNGEDISGLCPPEVASLLARRLRKRRRKK